MKWEVAVDTPDATGESPFWHPREQRLYWVDIPGRRVRRWDPAGGKPEGGARRALYLVLRVRLRVVHHPLPALLRPLDLAFAPLAEVNAGGQLAQYEDVGPTHDLRLQRR